MRLLFVSNVFLAFLWVILMQAFSLFDLLVGFVIGMLILALVEPEYSARGGRIPFFIIYVLWEVLVSSLIVAGYILRPNPNLRQGIVAVPLDVTTPLEIAILASIITLTPGTLSMDIGLDKESGEQVLFVHALMLDSPEELIEKIKGGFERQILQISQGTL
jgi:multicomponent Na+:H+ antiporter subunit E